MIPTALPQQSFATVRSIGSVWFALVLLIVFTAFPLVANGGFVVSLGLNLPLTTTTTTDLDFGGAAATPFRFQGFYTDSGTHGIRLVDAVTGNLSPNLVRFSFGRQKIERLDANEVISGNDNFQGTSSLLHGLRDGNLDLEGDWASRPPIQNLSGYIGVRFAAAGNPTNFHYGWIHYTATSTSTSAPFSTGTINGWGYNTSPGQSILAGVPEPSALALVGGLATALSVLDRRRRSA
ncbi:MAG: PEP-CTERM sorting domain-containing protein [Planctomycetota bacterium]